MSEELFQAIRIGDQEGFERLLKSTSLNWLNIESQNALHEAIAHQREDMALQLLELGIDVNIADSQKGQTPLHYAAAYSQLKIVQEILRRGGDFNIEDKYGNQPLWTAVVNANGNYAVVKEIIDRGANLLHVNKVGLTPLDVAKEDGRDDILIQLMS